MCEMLAGTAHKLQRAGASESGMGRCQRKDVRILSDSLSLIQVNPALGATCRIANAKYIQIFGRRRNQTNAVGTPQMKNFAFTTIFKNRHSVISRLAGKSFLAHSLPTYPRISRDALIQITRQKEQN